MSCAAGYFCASTTSSPTCERTALVNENCDAAPCAGEINYLLFPTAHCQPNKGPQFCRRLGRQDESCGGVGCNVLFTCDTNTFTCKLRPGDGDACTLSVNTSTPTTDERNQLIQDASFACRLGRLRNVPAITLGSPGYSCVQTGTTTGHGTCLPLPTLAAACGIGPNLSATCADGAYCSAIDPVNLAPISGMCEALVAPGDACSDNWQDGLLGPQCLGNSSCGPNNQELLVCQMNGACLF